ncbi:hypothetical protein D3C84_564410 [compost metagenome]
MLRHPLGHSSDPFWVEHHRSEVVDRRQLESAPIPENGRVAPMVVRVPKDTVEQVAPQVLENQRLKLSVLAIRTPQVDQAAEHVLMIHLRTRHCVPAHRIDRLNWNPFHHAIVGSPIKARHPQARLLGLLKDKSIRGYRVQAELRDRFVVVVLGPQDVLVALSDLVASELH